MPAETTQEKTLLDKPRLTREQIAQRAALELPDGAFVNLGWGIPNLIATIMHVLLDTGEVRVVPGMPREIAQTIIGWQPIPQLLS